MNLRVKSESAFIQPHHRQYTITSLTITLSLHCITLDLLQLSSSSLLSNNFPSKFSTLKQSHSQCYGLFVYNLWTLIGLLEWDLWLGLVAFHKFFFGLVDGGAWAFPVITVKSLTTMTRSHQTRDSFGIRPPCHSMLYLRVCCLTTFMLQQHQSSIDHCHMRHTSIDR